MPRQAPDAKGMAVEDPWRDQEAGVGCYLCLPRRAQHLDLAIAELSVSVLTLTPDQRFRGYSVLILNDHVTRLDALGEEAYSAFMRDLRRSVHAIRTALAPDHMNLALLGNSCPHLHWGIAPRRSAMGEAAVRRCDPRGDAAAPDHID